MSMHGRGQSFFLSFSFHGVFLFCQCGSFARLPEISVEFHYTPFGEQFSTDMYVVMVYMSRAGNYRPGDKKRMQWSLQKISAWGPAARLRWDWLSASLFLGSQVSLWEAVEELLLWTTPYLLLQLGTGMECLVREFHQTCRLEALESFHLYSCSCSWLLCSSCEVVGIEDFLLLPWCVLDSRTI